MRITYDASADAVYFYLADKSDSTDSRSIDDDILIDFNAQNQMVGIEVLDASKRLRLSELTSSLELTDIPWHNLTKKLNRLKHSGETVDAKELGKWLIEEIGLNEIALKNKTTGHEERVSALKLLGSASHDELIKTLRELGGYNN